MRRPDGGTLAAAFLIAAGAAFTLWLGRGLTFFSDEWAFIEQRSLADPASWMPPHNEHWSTIPVILYRALVETVGLTTYLPYLALVAALHGLVVWLLYRQVRRVAGPVTGVAVAGVAAFLGSGFENLFWGFQIGFVGATAAGLAALELLDGAPRARRAAAIVALLLVGLMSTAVGVVFLVAVNFEMLVRRRWRRWLPIVALPVSIYGGWFLAYGRSASSVYREPLTIDALSPIPGFVAQGLGNIAGSILGVGPVLGLPIALGLVVLALARVGRGARLPARTISTAIAVVALYGLVAVSRAGFTSDQAHYPRYTYVAVILAVAGVAPLLGPAARHLVSRPHRTRLLVSAVTGGVVAVSLAWNVRLLLAGREVFLERAEFTRALIEVALDDPLPLGAVPDRSLVYVPSPASLRRLVGAYGNPLTDVLAPDAIAEPDDATRRRAEEQVRNPVEPQPED